MSYTTVEIHIPEAMKPYVTENNAEDELQRNALLLYPYVLQKKISKHLKLLEMMKKLAAIWLFLYIRNTSIRLSKNQK